MEAIWDRAGSLWPGKLLLAGMLLYGPVSFGGGTITNCTEAELRSAMAGGGSVVFACDGVIELTSTLLISQDTDVDGAGHAVRISGGAKVRLFQVNTNAQLQVRGLTLSDGFVAGAPGLDGSQPTNGGDEYGGGILCRGGTVTLIGCSLANNVCQGGEAGVDEPYHFHGASGGSAFGGGICSLGGTLNLTNCVLAGNRAVAAGGSALLSSTVVSGSDGGNASGGAIYAEGSTVHLDGGTVVSNSATGGDWKAGRGGDARAAALYLLNSRLIAENSRFVANQTQGGSGPYQGNPGGVSYGGAGWAGAIYCEADSMVLLSSCNFVENWALGGSGNDYGFGGTALGGALYNIGQAEARGCLFSSCEVKCLGRSTITRVPGLGGAVYSAGSFVVSGCSFLSNSASGANASYIHAGSYTGSPAKGGAIWSSGQLFATNTTLAGNQVVGGKAGLLSGGAYGGGASFEGGHAVLVNLTVAQNGADVEVWPDYALPFGGGLACTNTTVVLQNSIFSDSLGGEQLWGVFTDRGYNLCSDGTGNFTATGSRNGINVLLGPLQDNGGPTPTMALMNGSPARDAIPTGFPADDQRGIPRPQGLAGDIGAVEVETRAQLDLAAVVSGPNLLFTLPAQDGTYQLSSSPDLSSWSGVMTNSASGGKVQFSLPRPTAARMFFRVIKP
jgi:hypothetical protein